MTNNNREDFILLFLEKSIIEKNLSKSSINCYKNDLKAFYYFLKKNNFSLHLCTYNNIVLWIDYLRNQSFEDSTVSRKISTVKQFFNFSVIHCNLLRRNRERGI